MEWPIWICPTCKRTNTVFLANFDDRAQCEYCPDMSMVLIKDGHTRSVQRANFVLEPPASLEPELASDLREACACFNVEAYKASVVMARRFLEAFLDKRGFKGRTLADRIKEAHTSRTISDIVFQLASSARILGNLRRTIPTINWRLSVQTRQNWS